MRLHLNDLLGRAFQRGYTHEEVAPCLTQDLGGGWYEVDINHPAYPRIPKAFVERQDVVNPASPLAPAPERAFGPGTQLKSLLSGLGLAASPTCPCNSRASQMDAWGPDECERRLSEIVGWLEEEARSRKLPFSRTAARLLVKRAIRLARKAASRVA